MAIGMAIDLYNKKKTNNAQTIKGNQAEVEPYACLVPLLHISAGRRWWKPENKAGYWPGWSKGGGGRWK